MKPTLTEDRIAERLAGAPGWTRAGGTLVRTYDRGDFAGAMRFVNAVAAAANAANHHPDIAISWSRGGLTLTSHDAGGLTDRDFDLAAAIDRLAAEAEGGP